MRNAEQRTPRLLLTFGVHHPLTCPFMVPVEPYMEAGTPMCVEEPVPTKVTAPVMDCRQCG